MELTREQIGEIFNRAITQKGETHVCAPETCPDTGSYYVSCVDGNSWWVMAGPYDTHKAALADVNRVCGITTNHHGRAWFFSWGTVHLEGHTEPGNLNKAGLL